LNILPDGLRLLRLPQVCLDLLAQRVTLCIVRLLHRHQEQGPVRPLRTKGVIMNRLMKKVIVAPIICLLLLGSLPACSANNPPVIVAGNVAQHGTTLMKAIQVTQQAVAEGEKSGAIPRNAAIKSMEAFKQIGDAGQNAAQLLQTLADLPAGSDQRQTVIIQVQGALDLVDSGLFSALVPIGDEATREKIGKLATEISKTITIINRQILGGVQ
jgi:hypothetical protein